MMKQVKVNNAEKENEEEQKGLTEEIQFCIPFNIIAFCSNRIQELISNPSQVENWQLIPWNKFKQLLYNIYEHRIDNAAELNGSVNTSYCNMQEHLLIYFCDLLGSRALAEEKIVELFINLNYFYDQWARAKIYAWNLQIIPQTSKAEKDTRAELEGKSKTVTSSKQSARSQTKSQDQIGVMKVDMGPFAPHGLVGDEETLENDIFV